MARIDVRMMVKEKHAIERLAKRRGLTVTELVRELAKQEPAEVQRDETARKGARP